MRLLISAAIFFAAWSSAAAADDIWTKFRSDADGFSVEFPYTPTAQEPLPLVVGDVTVASRSYALDLDKTAYLVSVSEYSNKLLISNPQMFLDSLVRKQSAGGAVEDNSPIEVGGNPGREVVFTAADGAWVHAYEIYASGKLYQIVFREKGKDHGGSHKDAARFLKSFRFIPAP
ncbi:MAG TPA: hypothetical protein VI732_01805 [Alphaproteobacteria bacterium]|nr:hypothetical protein [Alphaproteobacteria bacterium]